MPEKSLQKKLLLGPGLVDSFFMATKKNIKFILKYTTLVDPVYFQNHNFIDWKTKE